MKAKDLVEYAKSRPYHLLIFVAALFLSTSKDTDLAGIIIFLFNFLNEYYQYNKRVVYLHKLGLTEKHYAEKKFKEEWHDIRQAGLFKYCLQNGGIVSGAILSLFIGLFFMLTRLLGDPTRDFYLMLEIIWKSFVCGFVICAVFYRFLWIHNEKRYAKLVNRYA